AGGSQRILLPSSITQLSDTNRGSTCSEEFENDSRELTCNTPLSVLRCWPEVENERVLVVIPILSVCSCAPVTASQSLTAATLPSGENATKWTVPEWPLSVCSAAPVTA